ncbi:MAG: GFA family protein [Pseudolabrys sp.]|jgi:hypothetical protein
MTDERPAAMEGGCTCGAVRYRMKAKPIIVHCCHCSWCQRETGSAFAVNAFIEASEVELLKGAPMQTTLPSLSGKGQVLSRCPDCGVTVWSNYAGAGPRFNFVRAGTLDDPSQVPPDIHIYTSTKQPWVVLPEGVPAVPEFYKPADVWTAEGFARFKAAKGG